jgi:hypothetical protein
MICLIAGSYLYARKWAQSQHLRDEEWFFPNDVVDLYKRKDYHVILVLDGIEHVSNQYVNTMLTTAWAQGRKK